MEPSMPTRPETDLRRAAAWLNRHRLTGIAPTPLLAARLAARRRTTAGLAALLIGIALLAVFTFGRLGLDSAEAYRRTATARLVGDVVVVLAAVLARWLWLRALRRADRRIGAGLSQRAAHPVPAGWRRVLGGRCLLTAAVLHAGALGVGAAAAVLASTPQDRAMAAVLLAGTAVLAATGAAEVADVVRRPALAQDAQSLAVDDVLRAEDARAIAASPLPAMLAVFTVFALTPELSARFTPVSFALVALAFLASAWTQPTAAARPATTS
jgi:hypothetical protein